MGAYEAVVAAREMLVQAAVLVHVVAARTQELVRGQEAAFHSCDSVLWEDRLGIQEEAVMDILPGRHEEDTWEYPRGEASVFANEGVLLKGEVVSTQGPEAQHPKPRKAPHTSQEFPMVQ